MRNKKAAAHLEMIIAFVLFVLFVVFILFYIKPYKTTSLSNAVISGLHSSFEEKTSVNLTKVFLKLDSDSPKKGCFMTSLELDENGNSFTINALTKVNRNSSLRTGQNPEDQDALQIQAEPGDSSFYTFVSMAIQDITFSCDSYLEGSTRIGSIEKTEIISKKEFEKFKNKYDNDYEGLKQDMEFPATIDFGISGAGYNLNKTVPKDAEVIARSYAEYVLLDTGEIKVEDFVFKIW